jgi:CheY-like chemotaxis protein
VDLDLVAENGFDFIGELKQSCPELPVIATTSAPQPVVFDAAKLAGAVEALRKPINLEWRSAINRVRTERRA